MRSIFLMFLLCLSACSPKTRDLASLASQQLRESNEREESWLHDGKLHFSTALEWQKASFQNKRATSSDFLLALNAQGRLAIDISANESLKTHSEELARKINKEFEIIGPAVDNREKFENQKVNDAAVLIASQSGWLKNVM
ncbi:hypothetical protein [Paraglaciecola sp.]|uniref:hypothetical protein n=1 Tax=Paraglaciecola sp. TaxID=1920173 RepID=UPI003262DC93